MKLLIFTQKIDKNDPILGFFVGWVSELAKKVNSIKIICLEKGTYSLPKNVTVYSLGKEEKVSRFLYLKNLYYGLYLIRGSYDKVFVHMNQEYVILAGLYWKLKKIPVYFWRNHPRGGIFTYLAVFLSTKVFATSKGSFTARFSKTSILPAGIDTNIFKQKDAAVRKKYSVCMVGRIAPIKHIDIALKAINHIVVSGGQISLTVVGSVSPKDKEYYFLLENYIADNNLSGYVRFMDAVSPLELAEVYSSHEINLNLTESGSFDKTIIEGAACGALPLVSNVYLKDTLSESCLTEASPEAIALSIQKLLDAHERVEIQRELSKFVESHSLDALVKKLMQELQ